MTHEQKCQKGKEKRNHLSFNPSHVLYFSLAINRADILISIESQNTGPQPSVILLLRDTGQGLQIILIITPGRKLLFTPNGQNPEIVLSILQCKRTGFPSPPTNDRIQRLSKTKVEKLCHRD